MQPTNSDNILNAAETPASAAPDSQILQGGELIPPANPPEPPSAAPEGETSEPPPADLARMDGTAACDPVFHLRQLLGDDVVLLPVPHGKKGCRIRGWPEMQSEIMEDSEHQAELQRGNISVLLGENSGGLCSIDLDTDEAAATFFQLNAELTNTLRSRGERGQNAWMRMVGEYPKGCKLRDQDGVEIGEWRADGNQTMIYGVHPSGCHYRFLNEAPPATMEFGEIHWPDDWMLPWVPDPLEELIAAEGQPFEISKNGALTLNQGFFTAKFSMEHEILLDAATGLFWGYEPTTGLWKEQSKDTIKATFSRDLKTAADELGCQQIVARRTNKLLNELTELLKCYVEREAPFSSGSNRVIHVGNGMLHLDCDDGQYLRTFDAEYYSRNATSIRYVAGATCPRFLAELLEPAMSPDDISLLQRFAGQVLLGRNLAQVLLLVHGAGQTGKGTFTKVLEGIIGKPNIAELRTKHLEKQFEISAFDGKSLLCGRDVRGDFLNLPGASMLKSLVGNDLLDGERKGSNGRVAIDGIFNIVIVANSRLRVRLDGDVSAWRRRLLIVPFARTSVDRPIVDFDKVLISEEGPGILNWMIAGAVRLLGELDTSGRLDLTSGQVDRVESLLCESDSVRDFVRRCVHAQPGSDVTSESLVIGYEMFCIARGWKPSPRRLVLEQLVDAMLDIHRAQRATDIERNGRNKRGYRGVALHEEWHDEL